MDRVRPAMLIAALVVYVGRRLDQHGISGGLLQAISAGAASTLAWAEVRGGRGFRYGV